MLRAIEIAREAEGRTSPNPLVGAVLAAGGRVIAEGYHARFGGAHAEPRLLKQLSGRSIPRDAVLYLTMEPCSYHGKTPACAETLLETSIRRFEVATLDPNPLVSGRGVKMLRRDGRDVRLGLLAKAARAINRPYFLSRSEGRARVTLKLATSIDGKVADQWGKSRWITGPTARREVGRLRAGADAIVVGRGTVEQDDPRLRSYTAPKRSPTRLVLDSRLVIDPDCRLARLWREDVGDFAGQPGRQLGNWFEAEGERRPRWIRRPRLIVAATDPSARRKKEFERAGWEVWDLPGSDGRIDLPKLACKAVEEGLIDLLVEPGPTLVAGFLDRGPVDRIVLHVAPKVLGGDRDWSGGVAPRRINEVLQAALNAPTKVLGADLAIELTAPGGGAIVPVSAARNAVNSSRGRN